MTAIKTTLALFAIVTLSSALGRQALGQSETRLPAVPNQLWSGGHHTRPNSARQSG